MSVTTSTGILTTLVVFDVPEHLHDGIVDYIMFGHEPGQFLMAVLCNDLFVAMSRADPISLDRLHLLIKWFHNHAPSTCFGSPAKVEHFMGHNGLNRGKPRT